MKTKTGVKAGGIGFNSNETVKSIKTRTGVKAGGISVNANQTIAKKKRLK